MTSPRAGGPTLPPDGIASLAPLSTVLGRQVLRDGPGLLGADVGAVDLDHLRHDALPLPGIAGWLHDHVVRRVTVAAGALRHLLPRARPHVALRLGRRQRESPPLGAGLQ